MSIKKLVTNIYAEKGIRGFYAGFGVNLVRILPNTAIMFMCYEYLSKYLTDKLF